MRGYRSELHSLRARVRKLERTLDEREAQHNLGPAAPGRAARVGYGLGRWVRKSLSWLSAAERQQEVDRLRAREQQILEELGELAEAPVSGADDEGEASVVDATERRPATYRAGRWLRGVVGSVLPGRSDDG